MTVISPLKQQFGARLRALIANSPLRQCDLAKALNVSNSAVSQMLIGKIVPRHSQLQTLCQMLAVTRDEELELASLLLSIRNGEAKPRSRFNQMFASARRERDVTLQQLAAMTGLPIARLHLFENCYNAVPLLEEIAKLAPVLECTPQDMMLAAGLGRPVTEQDGSLAVAEPAEHFDYGSPRNMLPVITLDIMKNYRRPMSIFSFASQNAIRMTNRGHNLPIPAAAVAAPASKLQLGISGEVLMLISDQLPPGYRDLELFSDKNNYIRIRERKSGSWKLFQIPGCKEEISGKYAVWSFYILELIICPVHSGMVK